MELPVLYEDEHYIAINKPNALLVHRTNISEDTVFALQLLRKQVGYRIYPVHRLDRATSGVLIFGKTSEAAGQLSEQMRQQAIQKYYVAIIRGFVHEEATIDYPLKHLERGIVQEARTSYQRLAQVEHPFAISRYPTSRYSLVRIQLHSGRRHQIRRHFAHLRHPIIGDSRYGDIKHNKYFREILGIPHLLLHARQFSFTHPFSGQTLMIEAPFLESFAKAKQVLELVLS
ncbi:MAG: pseudouridine synthase [Bacteroidota bacterium]